MTNTPSPYLTTLPGRLWKAAMGLVLAAVGGFFCWYLYAAWKKADDMQRWTPTPAKILSSEVREYLFNHLSRMEYQAEVRYEYTYQGTRHIGERIRAWPVRSSKQDEVNEWIVPYPAGTEVTAYVNPANPTLAVLKRNSKAALYSIWFPLLFVVGGLGMAITAFLPKKVKTVVA